VVLILKEEEAQMRSERNGREDQAFVQIPHFLISHHSLASSASPPHVELVALLSAVVSFFQYQRPVDITHVDT